MKRPTPNVANRAKMSRAASLESYVPCCAGSLHTFRHAISLSTVKNEFFFRAD